MAFITLTSDYGFATPYVAAIKGAIYKLNTTLQVVDISHDVKQHDILHATYILKNSYHQFPSGTVHLICVDTSYILHRNFLIVHYNDHFFIGADNGIFSLMFDEIPAKVWEIKSELFNADDLFPDKNLFIKIALNIINNVSFSEFAISSQIKNIKKNIAPVIEGNSIRGNIIFIDNYGNLISNISKKLFEERLFESKKFSIFYRGRKKINYISKNYNDVKNGDELALFNESGLLEIAMNTGNADQLLGLKINSQIIIEFYD